MTVKVAINGFGRIGRNVLRAIIESGRTDVEVVDQLNAGLAFRCGIGLMLAQAPRAARVARSASLS